MDLPMHLNAGAVSVMFLVTKVIDGISDLIVGFLIDKTNTKWGKSRPWILFGAVPFGVAAVLAFSVPDIGQTGMLIYAYITYILLSTAYTVVNIPMASILPALSEDPHERTVLASCRTFFSSIGSTVVSAFALTLVDKFGNGNEALGFRIVMMIFGVVGCLEEHDLRGFAVEHLHGHLPAVDAEEIELSLAAAAVWGDGHEICIVGLRAGSHGRVFKDFFGGLAETDVLEELHVV